MKYFTKEELEDITEKLILNPTRETLKELNDEYNKGETEIVKENPSVSPIPSVTAPLTAVESQTPTSSIPNLGSSQESVSIPNNNLNNTINISSEIPSFELPKYETQSASGSNNNIVNFNRNLWEPQTQEVNNLMETTDNFNSMPSQAQSTEVPVAKGPFFGTTSEPVNNPIPITGKPTIQEPTMFGQMQSNYGNATY